MATIVLKNNRVINCKEVHSLINIRTNAPIDLIVEGNTFNGENVDEEMLKEFEELEKKMRELFPGK